MIFNILLLIQTTGSAFQVFIIDNLKQVRLKYSEVSRVIIGHGSHRDWKNERHFPVREFC